MPKIEFNNAYTRLELAASGRLAGFIDRRTGKNYCAQRQKTPFAWIKLGEKTHAAGIIRRLNGGIRIAFEKTDVYADIAVTEKKHYFILEVVKLSHPEVDALGFANAVLKLQAAADDPFAACVLALNLKTEVPEMPGLNRRLRARAWRRFGITGAKAAIIGCRPREMRDLLKEAAGAAKELPHSPVGGPYALDTAMRKGSCLFDYGDLGEHNVDRWIELVHSLGFSQVEFHGAESKSFRFGDCAANPEVHPRGWDSFKAVIDKLHAAGIAAILHCYSFCLDPKCRWVTPKPDPRLAKDATFTLAADVTAKADRIPVVESTRAMSAVAGEYLPEADILQNGTVLQIDDELIRYAGVNKLRPYGFAKCRRGFNKTKKARHAKGARVYHLKECFGLFIPDGDSTLFAEVARRTADFYNYCGFDMIYLDALDAEAAVNGRRNGWHYGGKFAHELFRRLQKPALMEMATFHHHLWCLRSRVGAWDAPLRGFKRFIDFHAASNARDQRMFMPGHLGWCYLNRKPAWSRARGWHAPGEFSIYEETQFTDDIEYLCGKALATDACFALINVQPDDAVRNATARKKIEIIRRYEQLRHAGKVPETIKAWLRRPGAECVLKQAVAGQGQFHPVEYLQRKMTITKDGHAFGAVNPFAKQALCLRLEALYSADPYDAPDNALLTDFSDISEFSERRNGAGVKSGLRPAAGRVKGGRPGVCWEAKNSGAGRTGAWAMIGRNYLPVKNISGRDALGVWVQGDGLGEVLNFQLRFPEHVSSAWIDRCVKVDFKGWKYLELIEPDTDHFAAYDWPYKYKNSLMEFPSEPDELEALVASSRHLYRAPYHVFGGQGAMAQVAAFSLWFNNLPPGKTARCFLSPVKALALRRKTLRRPRIRIGECELLFPADLAPGQYLEFNAPDDCRLYRPSGELIRKVQPLGRRPELSSGENTVFIAGDNCREQVNPRARLTLIVEDRNALKCAPEKPAVKNKGVASRRDD